MTKKLTRKQREAQDAREFKKGWTPIRRAHVYCSPLCGGGCTYGEYNRAVKNAADLCARLGAGWKPEVWENLGWHWRVSNGLVEVHNSKWQNDPIEYSAWLQTSPQIITKHFSTPEKALRELKKAAGVRMMELGEAVHAVNRALTVLK